jgi:hypothetical protein
MAPRAIIQSGVVDTDEAAAYCLSTVSGQTLNACASAKTGARSCGSCFNISGLRPKALFRLATYG